MNPMGSEPLSPENHNREVSQENWSSRVGRAFRISSRDPLVVSHYRFGSGGVGAALGVGAIEGPEAGLAVLVGPIGLIVCGVFFQARRMREILVSTHAPLS